MNHTRAQLISILLTSLMLFAGAAAAVAQQVSTESMVDLDLPRRALVMGNSDYEAGPLENPENDARAMAGVLERAGFEVMLRTNRSLEEMDKDVRGFRESIEKGETALFFYAGHGVQVDGQNYLLPVDNEGIGSSRELRRRAILANDYIEAMNEAGAGINIVMLDACRDNPLPAETRGGARGLSVMSAPRESETVIVFATKAGSVAGDGDGENSTFTEAFLETVEEPDLGVMELFNKVGARVRDKTGGDQVPTIYSEPLSKSFSFFSSKRMAERAKKASREAQAELSELEEEIAARQRKIEQAEDEAERRRLEVEQQERKAKLAAQRLEAQNLEREAKRRAEEVAAAEEAARKLAEERARASEQQEKLEKLAAARRSELQELKKDAGSSDPDVLIETIERLEKVIEEVEGEYEDALRTTRAEIRKSFKPRLAALDEQEPEIWESDADLKERIRGEKRKIEREREREIRKSKRDLEAEEAKQTAIIRTQLQNAIETLDRQTWTLKGSDVSLEVGEYDRNDRTWPFIVSSNVEEVPVPEWRVVKDFSRSSNLKEELVAMDKAVKADGLTAEIQWKIDKRGDDRYYVVLDTIRLKDLTRNTTVVSEGPEDDIASFRGSNRKNLTSLWKMVKIISSGPSVTIYDENNNPLGSPPVQIHALEGSELEVRAKLRGDKDTGPIERTFKVTSRKDTYDVYDGFEIGDEGPAGGIVYYDKGRVSDGWRYLEAAPASTEWDDKEWGERGTKVGGTETGIGSGERNTEKIVSAYGYKEPYNGKTDYAAKLCDDLEYGGYDDWFLPSKDEIDKMYDNLKKRGIGGFASENYWSSSESSADYAWRQFFRDGNQYDYNKDSDLRVRASRAF